MKIELDKEYYDKALERIEKERSAVQLKLF